MATLRKKARPKGREHMQQSNVLNSFEYRRNALA